MALSDWIWVNGKKQRKHGSKSFNQVVRMHMDNHESQQATNYKNNSMTSFLKCNSVHWVKFNTAVDSWKHPSSRGEMLYQTSPAFPMKTDLIAGRNAFHCSLY